MRISPRIPSDARSITAHGALLAFYVLAAPSHAQTTPPDVTGPRGASQASAQATTAVDARTTSCAELKSRIGNTGTLAIAAAPTGGDTFHARAPQCEFWQRPQFSYVVAKDGLCGVGFVCTAKLQGR